MLSTFYLWILPYLYAFLSPLTFAFFSFLHLLSGKLSQREKHKSIIFIPSFFQFVKFFSAFLFYTLWINFCQVFRIFIKNIHKFKIRNLTWSNFFRKTNISKKRTKENWHKPQEETICHRNYYKWNFF